MAAASAPLILFWSEHCAHSRMLVDTVRRSDPDGARVRLVCTDGVRLPPKITHVPALVMPDKQLLFGRAAFDKLLLPGRGILVSAGSGGGGGGTVSPPLPPTQNAEPGEPAAVDAASGGFGASFSFIDSSAPLLGGMAEFEPPKAAAASVAAASSDGSGEATRSKKGLPGLDELRSQRDADLIAVTPPQRKI